MIRQLFLIICFFFVQIAWTRSQSTYSNEAQANLNLAGSQTASSSSPNLRTVTASVSTDCMTSSVKVTTDCQISVFASSEECGLVDSPSSNGFWKASYRAIGTNNQQIPLSFNFQLVGSIKQESTPSDKCLSISLASIGLWVYTDKDEQRASSETVFQSGLVTYSQQENIDEFSSYATVTPVLSAKTTNLRYKLDRSLMDSFIAYYNSLSASDQKISSEALSILAGGKIPTVKWKGTSSRVSLEFGQIINTLNLFGIRKKLKIPDGPEVSLGLSFDVDYNFNIRKSVLGEVSPNGLIFASLIAQAKTSACGGASSTLDYSGIGAVPEFPNTNGTLKLTSISVPDNYINPNVDLSKVSIQIGPNQYPLTYRLVTNVTEFDNVDVNIYPNPVRDAISVKSPIVINQCVIFDNFGRILVQENLQNEREFVIRIPHNLPSNQYYVKLFSGERYIMKKITVNR